MRSRNPLVVTILYLAGASCFPMMLRAQSIRNLPLSPLAPRNMAQCEQLQSQWDAVRQQVQSEHQGCLAAHSSEPSNPNSGSGPGSTCSHPGCQSLHTELFTILAPQEQAAIQQCRSQVARYQQEQQLQNANQAASGPAPTPLQVELTQLLAQARRLSSQSGQNLLAGQVQALLPQAQSLASVQMREPNATDPVIPQTPSSAASSTSPVMTVEQYEAAGLSPEAAKTAVNYDSASAITARAKDDVDQLTNQILASDLSQPLMQPGDPNAPVTARDFTEDDLQAQREQEATKLLAAPMVNSWVQLLNAPTLIEEGVPAFLLDELKDVTQDKLLEKLQDGFAEGCLNPKNEAYCAPKTPTPQPGLTPSVNPAPQTPTGIVIP
jgi:hypothetical protein